MLKITLTKGLIGKTQTQRKIVTALGLGKYGSTVVRADSPTIRGMVNKISHLVMVVEDKTAKPKESKAPKSQKEKVQAEA